MIRPVVPVITYYIDYDYIVAELCENKDKPVLKCHGKCHLTKEIEKANNGADPKQKAPPLNLEDYPFAPIPSNSTALQKYLFIKENQVIDTYTNGFICTYLSSIFQPPKFSC